MELHVDPRRGAAERRDDDGAIPHCTILKVKVQRLTLKPKLAPLDDVSRGVCYPRAAAGVWGRLRREDARDAAVFGRDDDVFAHVLTFWRSDRDVWG